MRARTRALGRAECLRTALETDVVPTGAYLKLVGALTGLGRRATEDEVRAFFAPYQDYAGLAGIYALHSGYI